MSELKKNELNAQELDNVTGGAYSLEDFVEAAGDLFGTIGDAIGNAAEVVADAAGVVLDIVEYGATKK